MIATPRNEQLWKDMVRRSFHPSEWYERDEPPDLGQDTGPSREARLMWVYRRTESNLWTVGFYTPSKEWNADSDWPTREEAARRVHYLNGGGTEGPPPK